MWKIKQWTVTGAPKLRLSHALRLYWKNLIGLGLFPPVCVFGLSLGIPFVLLAVPFFAVAIVAAWPYLRYRAPYSLWLVACAVWMAGGILAVVLSALLH